MIIHWGYEYLSILIMAIGFAMAVLTTVRSKITPVIHIITYIVLLFLGIAFITLTPRPGFPINRLPKDGAYSIYLPEDGYFVILERNSDDARLKPTLVQVNPKYVQYEKSDETPMMIIEPRSANDDWPGKRVIINLPYSVK